MLLPRPPSCPVPGSPVPKPCSSMSTHRSHKKSPGTKVTLIQMQLWGPPPGGVTVTPTWDLRGCGFQGQSSLISPMQLDSVLEVEHRGSTHLRTPDTCGAKGTPNRKEAAQTKQAEVGGAGRPGQHTAQVPGSGPGTVSAPEAPSWFLLAL